MAGAKSWEPLWRLLKGKGSPADETHARTLGEYSTGTISKEALASKTYVPPTKDTLMAVYSGLHHYVLIGANKKWSHYQSNQWYFLPTEPKFGRRDIEIDKFLATVTSNAGHKEYMQPMGANPIRYVAISV